MASIADRIGQRLASTKATGGGNFINPGKGILVVTALKVGGKPEYYQGDTAVGEFKVIECTGFPGLLDETGKVKPAGNPLGSDCSVVHQLEANKDTAWPNLLAMLQGIFGDDLSDAGISASAAAHRKANNLSEAQWGNAEEFGKIFAELTGPKQPARGMVVGYSTYEKETKKSKKIITLIKWEPLADTEEDIARRRAALDAGQPVTR